MLGTNSVLYLLLCVPFTLYSKIQATYNPKAHISYWCLHTIAVMCAIACICVKWKTIICRACMQMQGCLQGIPQVFCPTFVHASLIQLVYSQSRRVDLKHVEQVLTEIVSTHYRDDTEHSNRQPSNTTDCDNSLTTPV